MSSFTRKHETFTKINDILDHKSNNIFKRIKAI